MKTARAMILAAIVAAASLASGPALKAGTPTSTPPNYLMWQMPSSGISFPVYVYSGNTQSDYLYGTTQQAFIGAYGKTTSGKYSLYYRDTDSNWHSCTLALVNGAINASATNCPGAVLNSPVKLSNVYTVGLGATAWPSSSAPPKTPINTDYGRRTITFRNNTNYAMIQIGEICTVSANPNNPNCTNNANLFQIAKGGQQVFVVDDKNQEGASFPAGLKSYGFSVTAYKNASGTIVSTGGYGSGSPYATKIEFTSLPVSTSSNGVQIPQGATNFDISAVDGYNIDVRAYPKKPTYCTYTVPPENSNVLGAGYYTSSAPLASLTASAQTCSSSSQLPPGQKSGAWKLTVSDSANNFEGCMSPCTYATANSNAQAPLFCCTGQYGSPATCDQPPGQLGANNSTYVANLAAKTKNVYRFAYDDAIGDFACPAETDFEIDFLAPAHALKVKTKAK